MKNSTIKIIGYLIECTLATIEHSQMLKKPAKYELARQTNIAQTGLDSLLSITTKENILNHIGTSNQRTIEIIKCYENNVENWSKAVRKKFYVEE